MLLRSLRIVQFRGVADLQLRDIAGDGVRTVTALPGGSPGVVSEALRFVFTGAAAARGAVSDGAGFAWVEARFRAASGDVSIFRGVDRRGVEQVSLREDAGARITSGADAVRARLEEVLGMRVATFERATFVDAHGDVATSGAAASPVASAQGLDTIDGCARAVAEAIDVVRRALRVRALETALARDFGLLVSLGGRLTRERANAAAAIDAIVSEREAARTRLRRLNEYRDAASRLRAVAVAAAPPPAGTSGSVPAGRALALCAAGFLALFVVSATAGGRDGDVVGRVISGAGFVVAAASCLWVVSRRQAAAHAAPAAAPGEDPAARAALRTRFADLGDPDADGLVEELRGTISRLDARASPLQTVLERIDDASTFLDVEIGRAGRALRRTVDPRTPGPAGLAPGETAESARAETQRLGDAIHQACVERDALTARALPDVVDAARNLEQAFASLGVAAGDAGAAAAVLVETGTSSSSIAAQRADADESAIVSELRAAAEGLIARARAAARERTPAGGSAARLRGPDDATLLAGVVPSLTSGRFVRAATGPGGRLDVVASDGRRTAVAELDPALRARILLALRIRAGEECVRRAGATDTRALVFDERPRGFPSDSLLAAFVAEHAPSVTQVIVGA